LKRTNESPVLINDEEISSYIPPKVRAYVYALSFDYA
jgi:hypothetical protein